MTSKPWMPWYVADFVGDTQHLDAAETGAYMLLLGHYWLNDGKLPEGDAAMARVARMTPAQWKRSREALLKFFPEGRNKRADEEMVRTAGVSAIYSSRARQAAETRWSKHRPKHASSNAPSNASSNTQACLDMPISQSQRKDGASAPPPIDPDADLFRRGKEVLGPDAGSLIARLKKSKGGSIAHARAAIEQASTKQNAREYIGRVIAGPQLALMPDGQPYPEGIV